MSEGQMTLDEAKEAIQADVDRQDAATNEGMPVQKIAQDQAVQAESKLDVDEGTTGTSTDSDIPEWNLDINALPDEVKPFAKSVQGDYTRKSQELAEMRKQYEHFGDPDDVAQAVALARAFQSDPVATLHKIESGLRDMGVYTEPASSATPTQQVVDEDPVMAKLAQEYGKDDPLFQLAQNMHSELKNIQEERSVFTREKSQAEQARIEREYEEYLGRTEIAVRHEHPEWNDEDLNDVYDLVMVSGGDMLEASKKYEDISNRAVVKYLQRKTNLPTGAGGVPASGPGTQGLEAAKTTTEATRLAKEELESLINLGEFNFGNDY